MISMLDHEVDIERKTCQAANNPHHSRSEGDVVHEMSIHDIAMDPICACGFDAMDFVIKSREIGGKNDGATMILCIGVTEQRSNGLIGKFQHSLSSLLYSTICA